MEVVSVAVEAVEGTGGLLAGVASVATLEELEAIGGSLVGEAVIGSPLPVVVVVVSDGLGSDEPHSRVCAQDSHVSLASVEYLAAMAF